MVENADIKSNYTAGLQNLRQHIGCFDRALVLSSERSEKLMLPKKLLRMEKGIIVEQAMRLPKWAERMAWDLRVTQSSKIQYTVSSPFIKKSRNLVIFVLWHQLAIIPVLKT